MNTNVELTKSFQEKIYDKIRENIGTLMSDEDMKKLVDTAMERAFFQPVIANRGSYHNETKDPPVIIGLMQELLKDQVRTAAQCWLDEHSEEVGKLVTESIEKGVFGMMRNYIDNKTSPALMNLKQELANQGIIPHD